MSTTNEAFLFRVIEHSNNGTVDWQKVGDIFGIKKNAAYMRFDRMKKKFDTVPGDAAGTSSAGDKSADGDDQPETPKKATKKTLKKTPAKKGTPNKKRKIDDEGSGDGAEEQSPVKGEPEDEDFQ
ncbi:hypothetical protein LTR10_001583 [Elasticomyces elasticus]|nr:hypothetical protein LTR10_001583 [Elasticomyces elasticus]KAK4975087.1 hypothetical protein LTR42_004297 [Elasticomyces elasticus]